MIHFLRASRVRRLTASFGLSLTAAVLATAAVLTVTLSTPIAALARPSRRSAPPSLPRVRKAMVRVETARLRSGPGEDHKPTALLDAGRAASVVARNGDWAKLRLESGREGWVRADLLKISKKTVRVASAKSENGSRDTSKPRRNKRSLIVRSPAHPKVTIARTRSRKTVLRKVVASRPVTRKAKAASVPLVIVNSPALVSRPLVRSARVFQAVAAPVVIAAAAPEVTTTAATAVVLETPPAAPEPTSLEVTTASAPPAAAEAAAPLPVQVAMAPASATPRKALPPVDRNLSRNERIARNALSYRGMPYRMGATGRGAFDCSGFMMYLFDQAGLSLPRTAAEQYRKGMPVSRGDLRPGDLVFFKNTYKRGVSHVGIYIGNGQFCHASSGGHAVRTDSLSKSYYVNHWAGARRAR
ncbi:MAG: C40 family peptidase [Cytophagales bacterium]|nr:C40 family peptidase [Armatimonadota bacterium]